MFTVFLSAFCVFTVCGFLSQSSDFTYHIYVITLGNKMSVLYIVHKISEFLPTSDMASTLRSRNCGITAHITLWITHQNVTTYYLFYDIFHIHQNVKKEHLAHKFTHKKRGSVENEPPLI